MLLADVLAQAGIRHAAAVVRECETHGVPVECVCVLLVKESGGGRNVYGHDLNACFSVGGVDILVSRENYAEYLKCVEAGGKRNGVGPMQLTYITLQQRADELGGCWDPEVNIRVGVEHFANLLASPGTAAEAIAEGKPITWAAFRRYNGKPAYADHAMSLLPHWQAILQEVVPVGYMEGCDRSLPASDTNSTKRLVRCDGVIVHTIGGGPGPADKATWAVRRDGYIWQHRSDDVQTAANLYGNPYYLAIENGDRGPGWPAWPLDDPDQIPPLTPEQVEANAKILAYVHKAKGVPLVLMPDSLPGRRGVGYHRLGIDGNFGSYDFPGRVPGGVKYSEVFGKVCPTDVRIHQIIKEIIPRARVLAGLAQEVTMGDVDWADPITRQSVPGFPKTGTTTLRDTVAYLDSNLESIRGPLMALGPPIADIRNKVDQLLALHGGETAWQEAVQRIEAASAQAAREGAREGVMAEVLAALDEMEQRLQADDAEQAKQGALQALRGLRDVLPE